STTRSPAYGPSLPIAASSHAADRNSNRSAGYDGRRDRMGGKPLLALAPYRVLDLTGAIGALCPRLLTGLGADVIRVDPPGGHALRMTPPFLAGRPGRERSLYWQQMNAGKRGVTLALDRADGRALLL